MKPLTDQPIDEWTVLWSQQRPRRRVDAAYLAQGAETRHIVGDLVIWFVGFDAGSNSNDKARNFVVPRLWFPRFARRLNLPVADLVGGLRDRINSLDDAEQLHAWLWEAPGVYTWGRTEREREVIDEQLAGGRPAFPSRLPSERRRASILRRELLRSFSDGGEYLTMVDEGYHAACAQVAGVPSPDLTPEMCLWAYPEIRVGNWDECIEDDSDEMPFPSDVDALAMAGIEECLSISRGVTGGAYACGDTDLWIAEGVDSYGLQPATKVARLKMLQTLAEDMGGGTSDEFELDGLDEATETALRRWCDDRWGG